MENHVNNYFVLKPLARGLNHLIKGSTAIEVFRQNSNEVVFQFAHETEHHSLTFFQAGKESFVFPGKKEKRRGGVQEFFHKIKGQEVREIEVFQNDRSFYISMTNSFSLVFKLYGGHANVILYQEDQVLDLLRKQFTKDWEKSFDDYHNPVSQTFEGYKELLDQYQAPYKAVKKLFPTFSGDFLSYLEEQGFESKNTDDQWSEIQKLLEYLGNPTYFICQEEPKEKYDPGIRLNLFHHNQAVQEYTDILEALKNFSGQFLKNYDFRGKKQALLDHWENEKKKIQKRINKNEHHLQKLINEYDYRTLGDIIMANLHQLSKGIEEAELYNFYNDQWITVKLKKNLTPQANAERYYRKSKNQALEWEKTEENLEREKTKLTEVEEELAGIYEENDFKQLKKLYQATFEKPGKQSKKASLTSKFKQFEYKGYPIFVGKGAKTNDLLTFEFANKNDLWLHARDRSGSHVIVRNPGVENFPENVIEKAAGLAAYFSKGKGEAMCPVVYTRKKYVWNPKGSDPGNVHYKFEEVIMAEPGLIENKEGA